MKNSIGNGAATICRSTPPLDSQCISEDSNNDIEIEELYEIISHLRAQLDVTKSSISKVKELRELNSILKSELESEKSLHQSTQQKLFSLTTEMHEVQQQSDELHLTVESATQSITEQRALFSQVEAYALNLSRKYKQLATSAFDKIARASSPPFLQQNSSSAAQDSTNSTGKTSKFTLKCAFREIEQSLIVGSHLLSEHKELQERHQKVLTSLSNARHSVAVSVKDKSQIQKLKEEKMNLEERIREASKISSKHRSKVDALTTEKDLLNSSINKYEQEIKFRRDQVNVLMQMLRINDSDSSNHHSELFSLKHGPHLKNLLSLDLLPQQSTRQPSLSNRQFEEKQKGTQVRNHEFVARPSRRPSSTTSVSATCSMQRQVTPQNSGRRKTMREIKTPTSTSECATPSSSSNTRSWSRSALSSTSSSGSSNSTSFFDGQVESVPPPSPSKNRRGRQKIGHHRSLEKKLKKNDKSNSSRGDHSIRKHRRLPDRTSRISSVSSGAAKLRTQQQHSLPFSPSSNFSSKSELDQQKETMPFHVPTNYNQPIHTTTANSVIPSSLESLYNHANIPTPPCPVSGTSNNHAAMSPSLLNPCLPSPRDPAVASPPPPAPPSTTRRPLSSLACLPPCASERPIQPAAVTPILIGLFASPPRSPAASSVHLSFRSLAQNPPPPISQFKTAIDATPSLMQQQRVMKRSHTEVPPPPPPPLSGAQQARLATIRRSLAASRLQRATKRWLDRRLQFAIGILSSRRLLTSATPPPPPNEDSSQMFPLNHHHPSHPAVDLMFTASANSLSSCSRRKATPPRGASPIETPYRLAVPQRASRFPLHPLSSAKGMDGFCPSELAQSSANVRAQNFSSTLAVSSARTACSGGLVAHLSQVNAGNHTADGTMMLSATSSAVHAAMMGTGSRLNSQQVTQNQANDSLSPSSSVKYSNQSNANNTQGYVGSNDNFNNIFLDGSYVDKNEQDFDYDQNENLYHPKKVVLTRNITPKHNDFVMNHSPVYSNGKQHQQHSQSSNVCPGRSTEMAKRSVGRLVSNAIVSQQKNNTSLSSSPPATSLSLQQGFYGARGKAHQQTDRVLSGNNVKKRQIKSPKNNTVLNSLNPEITRDESLRDLSNTIQMASVFLTRRQSQSKQGKDATTTTTHTSKNLFNDTQTSKTVLRPKVRPSFTTSFGESEMDERKPYGSDSNRRVYHDYGDNKGNYLNEASKNSNMGTPAFAFLGESFSGSPLAGRSLINENGFGSNSPPERDPSVELLEVEKAIQIEEENRLRRLNQRRMSLLGQLRSD